jgi:hypothetical protein
MVDSAKFRRRSSSSMIWPRWVTESSSSDEWFAYDADGRLTDVWESTPHSGGWYHTQAGYAVNGALTSISGVPGKSTYSIVLDSNGRPDSSTYGATAVATNVTYNGAGQTKKIDYGTDSDVFGYNSNTGLMNSFTYTLGATTYVGTPLWNTNRTLKKLTIVDGFNASDSQTCNFNPIDHTGTGYDDVGRLVGVYCGAVWNQTYAYDQYDNFSKAGSTIWNPGYNSTVTCPTGTICNHITGASYDGNGRVTYDLNNSFAWDQYGKMITANSGSSLGSCGGAGVVCLTYDALGRAVEKNLGGTFTQYLYSPVGLTAIMSGQTPNAFRAPIPGGAIFTSNGTGSIVSHLDWLGSARLSASLGHTVSRDTAFSPYGEDYASTGTGIVQEFAGMFTDHDTNVLFDATERQFDVSAGSRWLSPDPARAGWNSYSYVTNPNSSIDPSGLACYPLEKKEFGSCAGFMNNGVNFGGSWNEFDILNWALTAYTSVIPDPDRTVNYPYGWIDYQSGAFYPPGAYVFGWNYGNTFFPYAWLLNFDPGSYFNSYYNAKRSEARSLATGEDYIGALGSLARKAPDLCNPGVSASAKVAGYGPEVTLDQTGAHGDFSLGLGQYAEVGTADPSITFSAGEGIGGSVTLNANHPGIPTIGAFAGVQTSNELLDVDVNVHADVVAMGSCPH